MKFSIRHESEDFLHPHLTVQPLYHLKKRLLSRDRLLASLPASIYCRPLIEEDSSPSNGFLRLAKRCCFPTKSKSDYSEDLCFDDRGWQQQARCHKAWQSKQHEFFKPRPTTKIFQHLMSFQTLKPRQMTDLSMLMFAVGANPIQRLRFPPFLTAYPSASMPAENTQGFLPTLFSPFLAKLRFENHWIEA